MNRCTAALESVYRRRFSSAFATLARASTDFASIAQFRSDGTYVAPKSETTALADAAWALYQLDQKYLDCTELDPCLLANEIALAVASYELGLARETGNRDEIRDRMAELCWAAVSFSERDTPIED